MTAIKILNGIEYLYPENPLIGQIKRTLNAFPECEEALTDALAIGQLKSKMWLIKNLPDNLGLVFICAGWYGTLASLMFQHVRDKFDKIRSFDIDPSCADIAEMFNRPWVVEDWQFKASTLDITTMHYPFRYITYRKNKTSLELCDMPDTIINTSCEHIKDFDNWYMNIPNGKLLVLQSNNYFSLEEHVNCSMDLSEFCYNTPMENVLFSGELEFDKYTRFMRIGIK